MSAAFTLYANGRKWLLSSTDVLNDTLKVLLTTSSYTPNANTHATTGDITNEVTGTGYSAGGATVGSKAVNVTAANSWGTTWATGHTYAVGDLIRPTSGNGHVYVCIVAGTSHASTEPTWPTTSRQTVTDNTVTWAEFGTNVVSFTSADITWTNATITARYGVLYDSTNSKLIGYWDFGSDYTSTTGTFSITVSANGIFVI